MALGGLSSGGLLRVVFCHYTSDICGGSDRSLFDIVTYLPRDRFAAAVILKTGDPMAVRYRAQNIPVIETMLVPPRKALDPVKLARFFLSYPVSVLHVAWIIRRLKADVVHVNTLYNLVGPVAAKLAGRPLVWHVREMDPDSRVVRLLLRMVARLATRAVAISNAVADSMRACGPRLRTILNGIDLSEYDDMPDGQSLREELGIAPDVPVVTTVGRLEPWKGQHVLVETIPRVLERHPRAKFLIVGGPAVNKPDYEPMLRKRCEELGVSQQVLFTGIRFDIPAVFSASNVLVLPSATPEPFGRTIVEAMAARCPVVATAAGGPLDTVVDGETGHLVPANDPAAMAEKIIAILDNPAGAREMGEKGRARAYECFSLDRLVREMGAIIEEAAASGS
ncbi:MAG TPA: glycosyltransferase [Candidatus Hydrogenedentes bacterium]|nr:glycosyltransferase [Candidatus Hydrogenedentota bacterium]HRT18817.1 glycosyltransferase [Candidatus Hydrogenedentota bacterium]HRT65738.1 glycosyltransferase [Candidatus Hydrogenedentota bacterium]